LADSKEKLRNLVLVHTPGWQAIDDFRAIADVIIREAPDIEVEILSNTQTHPAARKRLRRLPTLVFSPIRLLNFKPDRGKVYCGQPMSKLAEIRRLAAGGVPIPYSEEIVVGAAFSETAFGPLTIVKPTYELAAFGRGVELMPTRDVRYKAPDEYPANHPGRMGPMIAQSFVDCGYPMSCRVLTLFGETIFTYCRTSTKPFIPAETPQPYQQTDFLPAMPHSVASMPRDADLLAVAQQSYQAMPEIALQACDILRDKDGRLFLVEINPGGGTWMFSNPSSQGYRDRLGIENLAAPFNAFEVCARLLIERTRSEAE
jgi:hypothetical protein